MTPKEFEELLHDVEVRLDRLKSLYEQYFQGIERLEPLIPLKEVERRIQRLRRGQPRNTVLRFRFHTLIQRYTTFQTYWRRVARQIEEGTYRRDVLRVRRRREEERRARSPRRSQAPSAIELDVNVDSVDLGAEVDAALSAVVAAEHRSEVTGGPTAPSAAPPGRSLSPFARPGVTRVPAAKSEAAADVNSADSQRYVPPPPGHVRSVPPGTRRPPPVPPTTRPSQGPDDMRLRRIYDEYLEARRLNNERTDNVSYEKLRESVHSMLPTLGKKHQGRDVDFEVTVRDGRVGLKPVVKKD